ncbi:MAG: DUF4412 domain-containing protein [Candidatus Loosdrechtia sp.]|uniref:DUF4412 domain-containing protein n=1 Tax=Candidatus Loosdrechtia sp. TaxID=3101272 RepID=UPI003A74C5A7|nr:MAG: DUF4412 domain-containing protein [Candidatus Jettenia sp. AMX2]
MKFTKFVLSFAFTVVMLITIAEAGIVITGTEKALDEYGNHTTIKVYVDANRMRVETKDAETDQVVIFCGDSELFRVIDNTEKTYMEMTKADLMKIGRKMNDMMKMLEEKMKNIPPQQREMMAQMMKNQMPSVQESKITYKLIASDEKVHQWICKKYEGHRDGIKTEEIWTANLKDLAISHDDLKVMKMVSKFFESFLNDTSSFYKIGSEDWEKEMGYSGIPVRTITYTNGEMSEIMEISEIQRQNLPASLFELPEELKKEQGIGRMP